MLRTEVFRSVLRKTATLLFCSTLLFPSLALVSAELWIDAVATYMLDILNTLDPDATATTDLCAAHPGGSGMVVEAAAANAANAAAAATTPEDAWRQPDWDSISDQLRQPLLVARRSLGSTLTQNGGSFFLLYVLQSAFLTNASALALLPSRFFRLLGWAVRACCGCCCGAERAATTGAAIASWQFPLEYHVATVCVIFAVVLTYSIVSPLILFVGLLYLVIKATADRFVLLFGHDGDLDERFSQDHDSSALFSTADTFVMLAVTVMVASMLQFVMEKHGPDGCVAVLGLALALSCAELWRKTGDESQRGWAQQRREVPPHLPKESAAVTLGLPGYYRPPRE